MTVADVRSLPETDRSVIQKNMSSGSARAFASGLGCRSRSPPRRNFTPPTQKNVLNWLEGDRRANLPFWRRV